MPRLQKATAPARSSSNPSSTTRARSLVESTISLGRDKGPVFAVLAVGDFVGVDGELVAVPFRSLKLDDPSSNIVLPGASRAAPQKLPVFLYNR